MFAPVAGAELVAPSGFSENFTAGPVVLVEAGPRVAQVAAADDGDLAHQIVDDRTGLGAAAGDARQDLARRVERRRSPPADPPS